MNDRHRKTLVATFASIGIALVVATAAWGVSASPSDQAVRLNVQLTSGSAASTVEASAPDSPKSSPAVPGSSAATEKPPSASSASSSAASSSSESAANVENAELEQDEGAQPGEEEQEYWETVEEYYPEEEWYYEYEDDQATAPDQERESNSGKRKASRKSGSSESNQEQQAVPDPVEPEYVWVEPVYERRTVQPDTGTRYCGGVNNGTEYGSCSESWHGTEEETYDLWYDHWQAYVQRRMAEEAEKGEAYVCDHVHDDSRWVPDPAYTEEVLVSEGYWKEV